MNLIDTYITEIGRNLPKKNRADIETEIRSALEDMLEERTRESGKPVDDELIFEVLKDYGAPEKVAASYRPDQYLIGPKLFPGYLTVLRIVLPIVAIFTLISAGTAFSQIDGSGTSLADAIARAIGETIAGFFSAGISAVGSVTLIFAILQWTIPNLQEAKKAWDPHSLLKISPPDQVKLGDAILSIVASAAALIIFNFYPNIIGISYNTQTGWSHITLLSETFFAYLPLLTIFWLLILVEHILLLYRGSRNTTMHWFSLGVKAIGIGIAVALLQGPGLLAASPELMATGGLSLSESEQMVEFLNQGLRVTLLIGILTSGWHGLKSILRLLGRETPPVFISKQSPKGKK